MAQFPDGISQLPIPLDPTTLVISDNADLYGTLEDLEARLARSGAGGDP